MKSFQNIWPNLRLYCDNDGSVYCFRLCWICFSWIVRHGDGDQDVCSGSGHLLLLSIQQVWLHRHPRIHCRGGLGQLSGASRVIWAFSSQSSETSPCLQSDQVSITILLAFQCTRCAPSNLVRILFLLTNTQQMFWLPKILAEPSVDFETNN